MNIMKIETPVTRIFPYMLSFGLPNTIACLLFYAFYVCPRPRTKTQCLNVYRVILVLFHEHHEKVLSSNFFKSKNAHTRVAQVARNHPLTHEHNKMQPNLLQIKF